MIVVADNSEILEDFHAQLKLKGVSTKVETIDADKTKKGLFDEIVKIVIENPEESRAIISYVFEELRSMANLEHIRIVKRDGTKITYDEYLNMSDEEKSNEIFSV